MKKFKVEYQRCPGSPVRLAGESDHVHVLDDVDGTDLVIIGFGATNRVCESGFQFREVIKGSWKAGD